MTAAAALSCFVVEKISIWKSCLRLEFFALTSISFFSDNSHLRTENHETFRLLRSFRDSLRCQCRNAETQSSKGRLQSFFALTHPKLSSIQENEGSNEASKASKENEVFIFAFEGSVGTKHRGRPLSVETGTAAGALSLGSTCCFEWLWETVETRQKNWTHSIFLAVLINRNKHRPMSSNSKLESRMT